MPLAYNQNYDTDIDNQNAGNYVYDKIGNLTADHAEHLKIDWNMQNKVTHINKPSPNGGVSGGLDIFYEYDALGNRVRKAVSRQVQILSTSQNQQYFTETTETYYSRDAQGNVLSTYNSVVSAYAAATFSQESVTLYGSARLGEYRPNEQDANAKSLPATRAYQLLRPTFKRLQKIEPKIKDFGPVSQDLAVIKVFDVVGALESIKKGDIDKAIAPLIKDQWGNTQFASLPGGGQEAAGMSIDKVKTMFKQNIVKELNNKSDIATH
ncbi:MAG: hypothetical protein RI894_53 [Bacteroidota bacterium]